MIEVDGWGFELDRNALRVSCLRCGETFTVGNTDYLSMEPEDAARHAIEAGAVDLGSHELQAHVAKEAPAGVWSAVKEFFGFTNAAQPKGNE